MLDAVLSCAVTMAPNSSTLGVLELERIWGVMRFVLYIFTWLFIVSTVGALVQGDLSDFVTGLFVSGLMVWWSKSVRDRRRRKLSGGDVVAKSTKPDGGSSSFDEALERANREVKNAESEVSKLWTAVKGEAKQELQKAKASSAQISKKDSIESPSLEVITEEAPGDAIVSPSETTKQSEPDSHAQALASEQVQPDPEPASELKIERPERPIWKDSQGRGLHVGAKVTFLANSKGQSVSIPGTLLGERDGQALIEVSSGALLPRNDYSIPWSVVTSVD
jgi:hypothetical protein